MSRKTKVTVMFIPAEQNYELTNTKLDILYASIRPQPAHWYVGIEFLEDNKPMSASIHQYALVTKPTRKQLTRLMRKSLSEHLHEWSVTQSIIEVNTDEN